MPPRPNSLPPIEPADVTLQLEHVVDFPVTGAAPPTRVQEIVDPPDGVERFYAVDTRGVVWVIEDETVRPVPFLDLRDRADAALADGEAGLRSLAFHPDYQDPSAAGFGKVYTSYTAPVASREPDVAVFEQPPGLGAPVFDSVIAEWTLLDPADPLAVDPASKRELLRIEQPFGNHNGNAVVFDPNAAPGDDDYGLLYVAVGDGGGAYDPGNQARDLAFAGGSILRIDPLAQPGGAPYGVPADNPFVGVADALDEIWAYGMRNPQALSFDAEAPHRLYASDIGQASVEEINVVVRGGNYGWDVREGGLVVRGDDALGRAAARDAVADLQYPFTGYDHEEIARTDPFGPGSTAIAGGFVYRGDAIPALAGQYVFGDFSRGQVFATPVASVEAALADGQWTPDEFVQPRRLSFEVDGAPTTIQELMANAQGRTDSRFAVDEAGELYLFAKQTGDLWRVVGEDAPPPEPGASGPIIGAVRRVSELGLDDRRIPFGAEFDDPVVFATPVSRSDPAPVTTRITELQGDGVRLRLDAPGYLDDVARPGEDLTVLALEEGVWDIGGGRRLEVGTVMTDLTASEGFAGVTFEAPFATPPVVVAQVQTANGPDWVVPRLDAVGRDGFRVALQEEEARAETGHVVEEIGWLALEPGVFDWDGVAAQAFTTGRTVAGPAATPVALDPTFGLEPLLTAGLASFFGPDPANLRLDRIGAGEAVLVAAEEISGDAEIGHAAEIAAGLVFEGEGVVTGGDWVD